MRSAAEKIADGTPAAEKIRAWREEGRAVAMARGRFDLIEAAHVRSLAAVKHGADRLAVEVIGDGAAPPPLLGEAERALLVAALRVVDLVTIVTSIDSAAVDVDPETTVALRQRVRERHGRG